MPKHFPRNVLSYQTHLLYRLGFQRLLCLYNTTWQLYPPLWTCSSIPCRSLCYFSSLTHWLAGALSAKALLQECSGLQNPAPTVLVQHQQYLDPGPSSGPTCSAGARAVLGIEPSENHATRPNSQLIEVARHPKNSLRASDTAPPAAEHSGWQGRIFRSRGRVEQPGPEAFWDGGVVQGILLLNL